MDVAGNLAGSSDAAGRLSSSHYDEDGNKTEDITPDGTSDKYEYDPAGNLIFRKLVTGEETGYTYATDGSLLCVTENGRTTSYEYDKKGRITAEYAADGSQTSYRYDDTGVLTGAEYDGEEKVIYSYTVRGILATVSGKDGETAYQYDTEGNLTEAKLPDGKRLSYGYDEEGRRSSITYPDGDTVSYSYDEAGRLQTVTGLDGSTTAYEYDQAGRRIRTSSGTRTTDYRYNSVNQLISQTTTGDTELSFSYTYDRTGKMLTEKRLENGSETLSSYIYDAAGELTSFERVGGSYNGNDSDVSGIYQENYSYDAAGNMTRRTINGLELSMAYDHANRMGSMESENGRITYQYDANGNLTRKESSVGVDSYTYQKNGVLASYTGYDGYQERYTCLPEGMLSSREAKGDGLCLTQEELLEGKTLEDKYTEEALLAHGEETDQWIRTEYVYDMSQEIYQLLEETTEGRTTRYEYGLERISAYLPDTSKQDYLHDGRGSVAEVLSHQSGSTQTAAKNLPSTVVGNQQSGNPEPSAGDLQVITRSYTPYGETLEKVEQALQTSFGYNGEQYNAATGMLYLRARWYEPSMNRFNQKDVLGGNTINGLTLNRYLYALNNPVKYQDPSGKFSAVGLMLGITAYAAKRIIIPYVGSKIVQAANNGNTTAKMLVNGYSTFRKIGTGQVTMAQIQAKKDQAAANSIIRQKGLSDRLDKNKYRKMTASQQLAYVCDLADRKESEEFWKQDEKFFTGRWWQDERKLQTAVNMLKKDVKREGKVSLNDYFEEGNERQLQTIQVLVSLNPNNNYTDQLMATLSTTQTIISNYGTSKQAADFDKHPKQKLICGSC